MPIVRNPDALHYVFNHKDENASRPTLLLIHGLFARESALGVIERYFPQFNCLKVDLPNHGDSYYTDRISYKQMSSAVFGIVEQLGLDNLIVIGHSMGGKVAMSFSNYFPEVVKTLIVLDIAPVIYGKRGHNSVLSALNKVMNAAPENKNDALAILTAELGDSNLANFFMKSFTLEEPHRFYFNLPLIESDYINISGWSNVKVHTPTLFIYGGQSDYVNIERQQVIPDQFTNFELIEISQASHWIHIDGAPDIFKIIENFLVKNSCM